MTNSTSATLSAAKSGNAPYAPAPGDVILTNFTPQAGSEQAGKRPALVISAQAYNAASGFAFVVPITGQVKGYPFEVLLPESMRTEGVALADHMRSMDLRVRGVRFLEAAPAAVLDEVRERLRPVLGY